MSFPPKLKIFDYFLILVLISKYVSIIFLDAGKAMSVTSQAPPAPTEQYKLVPSKPAAAEVRHRPVAAADQKKPLA
jgi:hypothetical protein